MASQNYQIFVQSAQTTNQIKNSVRTKYDIKQVYSLYPNSTTSDYFIPKLSDGSKTVTTLTGVILPSLKRQINAFSDTPCNKIVAEKEVIDCLFRKREFINTLLEMPWTVRRCLAEEKLPDAIKVLQASQDFMRNIHDPPPALQVIKRIVHHHLYFRIPLIF